MGALATWFALQHSVFGIMNTESRSERGETCPISLLGGASLPVYLFSARDGVQPWGKGAHPTAEGLTMALLRAAGCRGHWPDSEEEGETDEAAEKRFAHALDRVGNELFSSPALTAPFCFSCSCFSLKCFFWQSHRGGEISCWKGKNKGGKKLSSFTFPSKSEYFLKIKNRKKYK